MSIYTVKLSDSNGLSANVVYVRHAHSHKVEYYNQQQLVGEDYFNTEFEATQSAQYFVKGDLNVSNFNVL